MAAILLVGLVGYTQLPVSALPEVDYPTIQVLTFYPGASPTVISTTVTAPLERQFGELQGLSQMTSTSSGGTSVIVLQFNLTLAIDVAEEEVQSAINASQSLLPSILPSPPIYSKTNPADAPVLTLAITSSIHAASSGRGPCGHAPCAKDFAAQWGRPCNHQWRAKTSSAHSSQPNGAVILRHQPGRPAHCADTGQCERRQRELRWAAPGLPDRLPTISWSPATTIGTL